MIPVSKWQLEQRSVCAPVKMLDAREAVNTFLSTMVTHFEQEGVPVHQVSSFVSATLVATLYVCIGEIWLVLMCF